MKELITKPTFRVEIRKLKEPTAENKMWGVLPTELVDIHIVNEEAKEQMLRGLVNIISTETEGYWFDYTRSFGGEIIIISAGSRVVSRVIEKRQPEPETMEDYM